MDEQLKCFVKKCRVICEKMKLRMDMKKCKNMVVRKEAVAPQVLFEPSGSSFINLSWCLREGFCLWDDFKLRVDE